MPKTCCVPGCLNRNGLYKFPLYNQTLFDIWKQRIANPRFKNRSDQRIYHMYSVCPEHFIEDCKTTDKRQLKKYSLPNINVPGFLEEPNIANAFYSSKNEIDVAGQGDVPKFDEANTNDIKQIPSKNLKEKNAANKTGRNKIIKDDKLNTKPCAQTQPAVRIVTEEQISASILRINKLKNDKIKRVHFAENVLIKEFVKNKPTILLNRNVPSLARAVRSENVQGDELESNPKHGILIISGQTQPVAHERTEKTDSSNMIPAVTLKNAQTEDITNILASPCAEEKKTEDSSNMIPAVTLNNAQTEGITHILASSRAEKRKVEESISNTLNAVRLYDEIKPIRMESTDSKACVDSKINKIKHLTLTGISAMSIVPYENTYLCTYSELSHIHSPLDAI